MPFRCAAGNHGQGGTEARRTCRSRGNTQDLAALYRGFRGRDPSVEALLEDRGIKE